MPQFIPSDTDLKRVVNSAPLIIFQVDTNGIFTLSEGAALIMIGLKSGEAVGLSIYDLYKDYPLILNSFKHVLTTGEDVQFSVAISDKLFFETKMTPVKQHDTVVGVNGVSYDISEQKFLENELTDSEIRYRTFVESAPFGILLTQDTITQYFNDKFTQIFGYKDKTEFTPKPTIYLFAPKIREMIIQRFVNRAKGIQQPNSYETIGLKKSGEEFPILITVADIDYFGKKAQLYFLQDITEQKKAEEQNKLIMKQLMQSQKLESLGILAGGIAHDFNNLLVGIIGYTSLILNKIDSDSDIYDYISKIEKTSKLASDLTRQMLNYSGKGQFKKEVISIKDLIYDNEQLFKSAVSKSHQLIFNFENELPLIEIDTTQIRQVILNLISNASESIEHYDGIITVSFSKKGTFDEPEELKILNVKPGLYLVITVQDNGKGIEQKNIEKIFDPFFTTKHTGRGLGLAVVHGIINGHNGVIQVQSEINKGTKIIIYLPVKEGLEKKDTNTSKIDVKSKKNGTILVCDDEEVVIDVASKMLEKLGFKVIIAHDGLESLNNYLCHQNTIDLVLLDLTMPKMGGEEVFFKIRDANPHAKIILTSGFNEKEVMVKFSGSPGTAFLQKPYSYPDLTKVVNEMMDL